MTVRLVAAGVALLATSCATTAPPAPERVANADRAQDFVLEVTAGRSVVEVGEPIALETTLTYEGEGEGGVRVWGSGSGLVGFGVERLEDGLTPGAPVFTGDCAPHEFDTGVPVSVPFAKSGAYDEHTPNVDFIRRYLDDPELRLPAGTWRITATATGYLGESCAPPQLDLSTSVEIHVVE